MNIQTDCDLCGKKECDCALFVCRNSDVNLISLLKAKDERKKKARKKLEDKFVSYSKDHPWDNS